MTAKSPLTPLTRTSVSLIVCCACVRAGVSPIEAPPVHRPPIALDLCWRGEKFCPVARFSLESCVDDSPELARIWRGYSTGGVGYSMGAEGSQVRRALTSEATVLIRRFRAQSKDHRPGERGFRDEHQERRKT